MLPLHAGNKHRDILDTQHIFTFPHNTYDRTWGSILVVYYSGDCHRLPSVGIEPLSDVQSPPKLHVSDI